MLAEYVWDRIIPPRLPGMGVCLFYLLCVYFPAVCITHTHTLEEGWRRERGGERERGHRERERKGEREGERERERQDYFIVRPPDHYNRSEHSDNLNSHGSNDGLKLSFLVFKALKTKVDNIPMVGHGWLSMVLWWNKFICQGCILWTY